MIRGMSHTTVFVLDQESAKAFYTEKFGFEVRFDITMGDRQHGRVISVCSSERRTIDKRWISPFASPTGQAGGN